MNTYILNKFPIVKSAQHDGKIKVISKKSFRIFPYILRYASPSQTTVAEQVWLPNQQVLAQILLVQASTSTHLVRQIIALSVNTGAYVPLRLSFVIAILMTTRRYSSRTDDTLSLHVVLC